MIAARRVVALAGALTSVPVFRLGRRIAGETAGLLAAGFLAVAPLHVRDSHFAMTDVLMTLLLAMALAAWWRRTTGQGRERLARTGGSPSPGCSADWRRRPSTTRRRGRVDGGGAGAAADAARARSGRPPMALADAVAGVRVALARRVRRRDAVRRARLSGVRGDFRYDLTHLSGGHAVPLGRGWYAHAVRSLPYGCGPVMLAAAVAGS